MLRKHLPRVVFGLGLIVPPLVVVFLTIGYLCMVPFFDHWQVTPYIINAERGGLNLKELWLPHNEHRILTSRLLFIALAFLSGNWNIPLEMIVCWIIAFAGFVCVAGLVFFTIKNRLASWVLLATIAWLYFSMSQWENWSWSFQVVWFLTNLCLFGVMLLLAKFPNNPFALAGSIVLAIIAEATMLSGLMIWIVVLVGLLVGWRQWKLRYTGIWFICGTAFTAFYFVDYKVFPQKGAWLSAPFDAIQFVFTFIGSPMGVNQVGLAMAMGVVGVLATLGLLFWIWRTKSFDWQTNIPWLTMMLFALINAVLAANSRVPLGGVPIALASRYNTISMLFWMGVFVILTQQVLKLTEQGKKWQFKAFQAAIFIFTFVFAGVLALNASYGDFSYRVTFIKNSEPFLYDYGVIPPEVGGNIFPAVDLLKKYAYALDQEKLLVYRTPKADYMTSFDNNWQNTIKSNNYKPVPLDTRQILNIDAKSGVRPRSIQQNPNGELSYEHSGKFPAAFKIPNIYTVAKPRLSIFPWIESGSRPILEIRSENAWFADATWNIATRHIAYGLEQNGQTVIRLFLPDNANNGEMLVNIFYRSGREKQEKVTFTVYNP